MKLFVITPPVFLKNESEIINSLFEIGLENLHFRKPNSSLEECEQILQEIPANFRAKIVIHNHSELVNKLELKGLHSSSEPRIIGKTLSRSCHSFSELAANIKKYDYLFISSIFDSISKPNLKSSFTINEIETALVARVLNKQVVALGGINLDAIKTLHQLGFKNAAILGYLWEDFLKNYDIVSLKDKFLSIQSECLKYSQIIFK